MSRWTKKSARFRMNQNQRLQEILVIEPRLRPILSSAEKQYRENGYDRYHTYIALRNQAIPLVGWHADCEELQNSNDYLFVINTIMDLLPPDDGDLDTEDPFALLYA